MLGLTKKKPLPQGPVQLKEAVVEESEEVPSTEEATQTSQEQEEPVEMELTEEMLKASLQDLAYRISKIEHHLRLDF